LRTVSPAPPSNSTLSGITIAAFPVGFSTTGSFLDLKSNGFNLEASRLRDKFALSQLCGVIALTSLFLVLQGTQVVINGKRRLVDAHGKRGMSYLKLGWNWVRLAITRHWEIQIHPFLLSLPDPEPTLTSKRQLEDSFKREFTVLKGIPAS
jgi:hypothetical protein